MTKEKEIATKEAWEQVCFERKENELFMYHVNDYLEAVMRDTHIEDTEYPVFPTRVNPLSNSLQDWKNELQLEQKRNTLIRWFVAIALVIQMGELLYIVFNSSGDGMPMTEMVFTLLTGVLVANYQKRVEELDQLFSAIDLVIFSIHEIKKKEWEDGISYYLEEVRNA